MLFLFLQKNDALPACIKDAMSLIFLMSRIVLKDFFLIERAVHGKFIIQGLDRIRFQ